MGTQRRVEREPGATDTLRLLAESRPQQTGQSAERTDARRCPQVVIGEPAARLRGVPDPVPGDAVDERRVVGVTDGDEHREPLALQRIHGAQQIDVVPAADRFDRTAPHDRDHVERSLTVLVRGPHGAGDEASEVRRVTGQRSMDDLRRLPAAEVAGQVTERRPDRCEEQQAAQEQRQRWDDRTEQLLTDGADRRVVGGLRPCAAHAHQRLATQLDLCAVHPHVHRAVDLHLGLRFERLGQHALRGARVERHGQTGREACLRLEVAERDGHEALRVARLDDDAHDADGSRERGRQPLLRDLEELGRAPDREAGTIGQELVHDLVRGHDLVRPHAHAGASSAIANRAARSHQSSARACVAASTTGGATPAS